MLKLSRFLALLAAFMLVIGGAPAVASADPCDPCPPDCPMMKQQAASAAAHDKVPDANGKADDPCRPSLACQAPVTIATPQTNAVAEVTLTSTLVDFRFGEPLAPPSRPPDRSLRPPIQL